MKIKLFFGLFLLITLVAKSQNYNIATIDSILKIDVNSVVRNKTEIVTINAVDNIHIKSVYAVTIFNKKGENHIQLGLDYNSGKKINKLYAVIFDKFGKEIKKIKQSKFKDFSSNTDYTTLAVDDRYKFFEYKNSNYPYTIELTSEYTTTYSCFLNSFYFQSNYNQSIEKSEFVFINPSNIPFNKKKYNLNSNYILIKEESNQKLHYVANKIPSLKYEMLAPHEDVFPHVSLALEKFNLYKMQGEASTWGEMGKWQYENLIKGRGELPKKTLEKISKLTAHAKSDVEKAKIIYNYVQNKTRYVSVQLGIGGWQPILASEVDRLGYGDCKALTNYTMSLLNSQNIPANYSVVFSGNEIKDYNEDLIAMQGNHVILNLPQEDNEDIWLECTSQSTPFGYISGFTDNRKVLVITPQGGKIKNTKKYFKEENLIATNVTINVTANNHIKGFFKRSSSGSAYNWQLGVGNVSDKEDYYQKKFNHLNNLNIFMPSIKNDRDAIRLIENFEFKISSYGSRAGKKIIIKPIVFDASSYKKLTPNRTQPIIIQRGYTCEDTYTIYLRDSLKIYAIPESKQIASKFGTYHLTYSKISDKELKVVRKLTINDGQFLKEDYKIYNEFYKFIEDQNKTKFIITE